MWCSSYRRIQHLYLVSWYVILIDTMYDWAIVQLVHLYGILVRFSSGELQLKLLECFQVK